MSILYSISYTVLLIWIIIFEWTRKKNYILDSLSFIHIFYTLGFILPGIALNYDVNYQGWYKVPHDIYDTYALHSFVLILIGYILILIGYIPNSNRGSMIKSFLKQIKYFNGFINFRLYHWVLFSFLLSFISIQIYASGYGGIAEAIVGANLARSGFGIENPYSFFIRFIPAVIIPIYMIASQYKYSQNKWIDTIFLIIMIILVIIGYMFMAGRANFVIFFGLLIIVFNQGKIRFKQVFIGGLLFLILMFYGDPIFNAAQYSGNSLEGFSTEFRNYQQEAKKNSIFEKIVGEFCYPFVSLNCALAYNQPFVDYRYFLDPIYALIAILPDRLIGIAPPDTVAYPNTRNVLGVYSSIVPPGILAFGLFNFGYLGILITTYLFGFFSRIMDSFFMNYEFKYKLALYFPWALAMGTFVINGEPRVWLLAQFMLVFYTSILMLFYTNFFSKFFNI